jgi:hypothetical protein
LNLIQEVLRQERKQRRLARLRAELAAIPDPLEEARITVEDAAFTLLYHADRMARFDRIDAAVGTYNRLIKLYPQTRWAQQAKQKLAEIQKNLANKKQLEI